ncbi:MAG: DNA-processing protein DprA [Rhodothermales bacterium]|nr:DNA-processing protein DprA [Rhodothermales bacterium]
MDAALEAGGTVCGVLSDSLEKQALKRDYREALLQGRLVLVSPFDPRSGFLVGHAMQRNKLIYALADAALVVNAAYNEGGTWAGAVEQLDKLRCVRVFVRSSGTPNKALDVLRSKGAHPWPDPDTPEAMRALLQVAADVSGSGLREAPSLFDSVPAEPAERPSMVREPAAGFQAEPRATEVMPRADSQEARLLDGSVSPAVSPAEHLFETVRSIALVALREPMGEAEFATAIGVATSQARIWLDRLVSEGLAEKLARPSRYRLTAAPR